MGGMDPLNLGNTQGRGRDRPPQAELQVWALGRLEPQGWGMARGFPPSSPCGAPEEGAGGRGSSWKLRTRWKVSDPGRYSWTKENGLGPQNAEGAEMHPPASLQQGGPGSKENRGGQRRGPGVGEPAGWTPCCPCRRGRAAKVPRGHQLGPLHQGLCISNCGHGRKIPLREGFTLEARSGSLGRGDRGQVVGEGPHPRPPSRLL